MDILHASIVDDIIMKGKVSMVKTKDEILGSIKDKFKDDTSDETISFIEDVTDTINDLENKAQDETDWKSKYEENDKEWREKYKERFFSSDPVQSITAPVAEPETQERIPGYKDDGTPMSFNDLFG